MPSGRRPPEILSAPDRVELGRPGREGRPSAIRYRKRTTDGEFTLIEEARASRKELAFITIWKKRRRAGDPSGASMPGEGPVAIRPNQPEVSPGDNIGRPGPDIETECR